MVFRFIIYFIWTENIIKMLCNRYKQVYAILVSQSDGKKQSGTRLYPSSFLQNSLFIKCFNTNILMENSLQSLLGWNSCFFLLFMKSLWRYDLSLIDKVYFFS